ncbi:PepSY domain-containing protein, partial [Flavobacterium circumlabens]
TQTYEESYSLGEFLYRLHFLAQVPYPVGYYLSGFVALFFLFAIVTGVLLHWNKIVSNFYTFRPKEKLKTLWTDSHTALGMIGLPFQFVYAVTGAFFMIKLLIVAPSVMALYKGDQNKLYDDLEYINPVYNFENKKLANPFSINEFVAK